MKHEKPVVGQEIYVVDCGNRTRGGGDQRPGEIVKVGRKYFTVEYGDTFKSEVVFNLDNWRQKTEYCQDYVLFENQQAYLDSIEHQKLYTEIRDTFSGYTAKNNLTLAQLCEIACIINT